MCVRKASRCEAGAGRGENSSARITVTAAEGRRHGVNLIPAAVTERPMCPVIGERATRLGGVSV